MCAKDYRKLALQHLSGHWGMMVLIGLIYTLIMSATAYTVVGAIVLGGPMLVGWIAVMLSLLRTGDTKVERLFDGFKGDFGNRMVGYILYSVFLALWSLLFVIPGIVKSYSYSMTFYLMHDHPEMTATEAITRSREMMNGHKWELFCLHFSFIGWMLLSVLTLGIGLLFLLPYMQMAQTEFYENLKNQTEMPQL